MVSNYIKKRYWHSCGKIIDEKNANIYLGVILSHKDTFMFCKLMELQRMYVFIFPLYLHYHRFDWKNFSITNAKNLFMRWFFYPIMIDWILNIFSFEFIIQSSIWSLTKLDCPFAIFKCHAYLSIIIIFLNIFLQSIPQVQTQVRRNTTLIYWRLMSFTQNLEFRDYEEN